MKVRIALGLFAAFLLVGVALGATKTTVGVAIRTYSQTVVDTVLPQPSPTPVVAHDAGTGVIVDVPSPVPTDIPTPLPSPTPEASFPAIPPKVVVPTVGATPVTVQVPQTAVFIGFISVNGVTDPRQINSEFGCPTGGGYCAPAPLTVVYIANFQGGFPGISPSFKWSNGSTEQTATVVYTTPGSYRESVVAYEVYEGVTYKVGAGNSVLITVS